MGERREEEKKRKREERNKREDMPGELSIGAALNDSFLF